MVKVRINKISFFFSVIKMLACNGLSFKERHSRDVPPTPGSSQRLLRLLQEAAVLRYINADNIQACGITRLTSKLMQLAYLRRVCHRHSRRLWKDLSTCCCCWRVIVFAYCFNIISYFLSFSFQTIWYMFWLNWKLVNVLCKCDAVNCRTSEWYIQTAAPLKAASPHRNLECLNLLLNIGADFNRKDNFGR